MKSLLKIACIASCLVALVAVAGAQEQLTFADLPLVSTPSPMPNGYGQLDWSNFYFVDPYMWPQTAAGFLLGPRNRDVVFLGSSTCRPVENACFGSISNSRGFALASARVAGGLGPTALTVTAYNNGHYVDAVTYFVTAEMRTLQFPAKWGVVTQVVFQATGQTDSLVLYEVDVFTLGG